MTTVLRVENVSKQYRTYGRPADRLKESLARGRLRRHKEFRVLRDIIFELEKGVTVGIAGLNGCGKINQHGPMHDHYLAPDVFSSNPFTIITNSAGSTGLDT